MQAYPATSMPMTCPHREREHVLSWHCKGWGGLSRELHLSVARGPPLCQILREEEEESLSRPLSAPSVGAQKVRRIKKKRGNHTGKHKSERWERMQQRGCGPEAESMEKGVVEKPGDKEWIRRWRNNCKSWTSKCCLSNHQGLAVKLMWTKCTSGMWAETFYRVVLYHGHISIKDNS